MREANSCPLDISLFSKHSLWDVWAKAPVRSAPRIWVADSGPTEHHMGMASLTRTEAYAKYSNDLIRFATGLAGPDEAQDLVASAVVKVLWSPSWDAIENVRAYLYRAVLNEARHNYRVTMRRAAAEAAVAEDSQAPPMPNVQPEVLAAVGRLSVQQRAVIFLAYWEDLRPAQIARRLGLSEGTVHRNLIRAEAKLRRLLDA